MSATQLVWLRHDLRLNDHPALSLAQQQGDIRVVFLSCEQTWLTHDLADAKLGLLTASLNDIAKQFADKGIAFDVLEANRFEFVAEILLSFCLDNAIQGIWFQQETPLDEQRRDQAVTTLLSHHQISVNSLPADLLVNVPVLTKTKQPYKVFTPFYKQWQKELETRQTAILPELKIQASPYTASKVKLSKTYLYRDDLWLAEETAILAKLDRFCQQHLSGYPTKRDIPAQPATSTLSPYLALGRLGPRLLLATIQYHCAKQNRSWQDDGWLRELAWRDFYRQLLLYFPDLSRNQPFKPETANIVWSNDQQAFQAWCEGKTGFPIIDAAMRQLNQTGWMHNRLRMLTASFLTKLLFINWRWGQRYFMQKLVDAEFAANNGGWQWSASTGCDAAPYFRIFNPVTQSEKYDPEGKFIKRFLPELIELDNKQIHWPEERLREACGYAKPIVDYRSARQYAIDTFKQNIQKN